MANWVKGKLKIRGKPEDIKRWVEECCTATSQSGLEMAHTKMNL